MTCNACVYFATTIHAEHKSLKFSKFLRKNWPLTHTEHEGGKTKWSKKSSAESDLRMSRDTERTSETEADDLCLSHLESFKRLDSQRRPDWCRSNPQNSNFIKADLGLYCEHVHCLQMYRLNKYNLLIISTCTRANRNERSLIYGHLMKGSTILFLSDSWWFADRLSCQRYLSAFDKIAVSTRTPHSRLPISTAAKEDHFY